MPFEEAVLHHGAASPASDFQQDGRDEVVIIENGPRPLAAQLACHGNAIEVIDPTPELKAEFVRIASELSDQWLR